MQVNGTTALGATSTTTTSTKSAPTLGYNEFLQLLIAQLKNQDPTTPADSTQFVAQLATFSNVEQAVQTNAKLDSILGMSALTQAGSLIGRTVTSADGAQSGIVSAVDTTAGAPTAVLTDGSTLALASGIRVS